MPNFTFRCPEHGAFQLYLKASAKEHSCPKCKVTSKRIPKLAHTTVMEVLDNGLMPQAVERMQNIDELLQERKDLHDKALQDTMLLANNETEETDD